MFRDKITRLAVKRAHSRVATPIIIQAQPGRLRDVAEAVRPFADEISDLFPRLAQLGDISVPFTPYPMKIVERFNMLATTLPREVIFQLAEDPSTQMIYSDEPQFAFFNTVPDDGVFTAPHQLLKEIKFTSTYWTKRLMGADKANEKGYSGRGITVSVTDTGASRVHEQLRRIVFKTTMKQYRDENGHGTHCASTVGGEAAIDEYLSQRSGRRVLCEGMAPRCDLLAVKCLGYFIGMGSTSNIIDALDMSIDGGANIISMSLGGTSTEQTPMEDPYYPVMDEVLKYGVIPVVAAGNEGPGNNTIGTPGALPQVLTVGAYNPISGKMADFSSRGPCFPAETWIAVADNSQGFRRIRDMKIGQKIWSYDEQKQVFEIDEVEDTYKFPLRKDVYEIHTEQGFKVRATEDHPFYVKNNEIVDLKYIKDLQEGDKVVVAPNLAKNSFGYTLSEETCKKMSKAQTIRHKEGQDAGFVKGQTPWCKGLTKKDDKRIVEIGIKTSERQRRKFRDGDEHVLGFLRAGWVITHQKGGDSPNYGLTCSEETKEKIRQSEYHKNMECENNPFYGKTHTDKVKKICREAKLNQEVIMISSQETKLFDALKPIYGEQPTQQLGVHLGPSFACIIDIALPENKVAIFVDGIYWHSLPGREKRDQRITRALQDKNWLVLRFTDKEIDNDLEGCINKIVQHNTTDKVTIVKKIAKRYPFIYHLKTKKNHTFIANGFAVHNTNWHDIKPDVVAPGVNIDSAIVGMLDTSGDGVVSRFSPISGTSMATPHVAGLLALMAEAHQKLLGRRLTVEEVKNMMRSLGMEKSNLYGFGAITWGLYEQWLSTQYGIEVS